MKILDESSLEDVAVGSSILGAGGGGDPYVGKLLAREAIREFGPVEVIPLEDLPDDALLIFIAGMGAPGVLVEKLPRAAELMGALRTLETHLGRSVTHICPAEAGGLNALTPVPVAAEAGLPLVDADGMGRAFPALELVTPTLYGGSCTPMSLVDEHGNSMVILSESNQWAETIARSVVVASGCVVMIGLYPMSGREAKEWLIGGVLSLAQRLGELLREARRSDRSAVEAIVEDQDGVVLIEGKVADVRRYNQGGWTMGEATIEGSGDHRGSSLQLRFQNEHLVAIRDGEIVATVPDLIMVLGQEGGEPIPTESIRYGFRVAVVGLPCDDRWRSEAGLALAGPRQFGYDMDFVPVEAQRVST